MKFQFNSANRNFKIFMKYPVIVLNVYPQFLRIWNNDI
jgi:hypothetical protein